jgi:hypothetical protein
LCPCPSPLYRPLSILPSFCEVKYVNARFNGRPHEDPGADRCPQDSEHWQYEDLACLGQPDLLGNIGFCLFQRSPVLLNRLVLEIRAHYLPLMGSSWRFVVNDLAPLPQRRHLWFGCSNYWEVDNKFEDAPLSAFAEMISEADQMRRFERCL